MVLSESMRDALNQRFNWHLTNVPELENPVLIILDFSPDETGGLLSVAFDTTAAPKCWMSEANVNLINGIGPKSHSDYKHFVFKERLFHPFSIKPLGTVIFQDIQKLSSVCNRLYRHVNWKSQEDRINDRTAKALGSAVMLKLKSLHFCIVGCGGTGSNFAEMLVRSGCRQFTLIDGGSVQQTELNRVFSFISSDVGTPKVCALKRRLLSICPDLSIVTFQEHFHSSEVNPPDHSLNQNIRDAAYDSDVVFIATDTNSSRMAIEKLCRSKTESQYFSCGVRVDQEKGEYFYVCNWVPETREESRNAVGYGPENASYAAIVMEATSVAFSMLLSHLSDPSSDFQSYERRYDCNFRPIETVVNRMSSDSKQSRLVAS